MPGILDHGHCVIGSVSGVAVPAGLGSGPLASPVPSTATPTRVECGRKKEPLEVQPTRGQVSSAKAKSDDV